MNWVVNKNWIFFVFFTLLGIISCKDPYIPDFTIEDGSPILVVEGYINASGPQSRYVLSQTTPLQGQNSGVYQNPRITGARISIEREDGMLYQEQYHDGAGGYVIVHPALDPSFRYRLRIFIGQEEYASDFVEVKQTPEIGDVTWKEVEDGVQVYVNTEDLHNQSRYYLWEYEETWRFSSRFTSLIILHNGILRDRLAHERVDICFLSENSSVINVATTAGLERDIVRDYPLRLIPATSDRLEIRYSILIKQRALTAEGFAYWDNLKNNSENLGDIFGTMPVELRGNIKNVGNIREPVIGLIEAGTLREKRIYIDRSALETHRPTHFDNPFYAGCALGVNEDGIEWLTPWQMIALLSDSDQFLSIEGSEALPGGSYSSYSYAPKKCADCSVRGGALERPSFWEE